MYILAVIVQHAREQCDNIHMRCTVGSICCILVRNNRIGQVCGLQLFWFYVLDMRKQCDNAYMWRTVGSMYCILVKNNRIVQVCGLWLLWFYVLDMGKQCDNAYMWRIMGFMCGKVDVTNMFSSEEQ